MTTLAGRRGLLAATLLPGLTTAGCSAGNGRSSTAALPTAAGGDPLAGFRRDLADLRAGRRQDPVLVLQLGDSHTAHDAFGSRMREGLQSRYGGAGRGPLAPGVPFRTYAPSLVKVTAEPGWRVVSGLGGSDPGPFGVSGLRQRADAGGATMTLETEVPGALGRAEVEILRRPGGGGIEVEVDGRHVQRIETAGPRVAAEFVKLSTAANSRRLTLRSAGDGVVELLSWSASRPGPGVLHANLGTIGATIDLAARWDPEIVRAEMEHWRPSLLLIAFGTNEGFRPEADPGYGDRYAAAVRALQGAAGNASVLVMGAPDGDWPARREGGLPAPCGDDAPGRAEWRKPPNLGPVRDAQRAAAAANGWAFWDWREAMGGDCAMHQWTRTEPPLAQPDHVHLRTPGYRRCAEALLPVVLGTRAAG